jgi:hypothetical protein
MVENVLTQDPRRAATRRESADPRVLISRRDKTLDNLLTPKMLIVLPNLKKERSERAELMCKQSSALRVDPHATIP